VIAVPDDPEDMPRADLTDDWRPHTPRAVLSGLALLLVLGIGLGLAVGLGLARLFDAADIEDLARDFSRPEAVARPTSLHQ
jgi:hypothetical protein